MVSRQARLLRPESGLRRYGVGFYRGGRALEEISPFIQVPDYFHKIIIVVLLDQLFEVNVRYKGLFDSIYLK